MLGVNRNEVLEGLPVVMTIMVGTMAVGFFMTTVMMGMIGFGEARLHYMLTIIFPIIITPFAAFPLVIMSQRLQRVKEKLESLLRLDGLTEIPNRRAFFERAAVVFSRDSVAAAMMIDIDHFKKVNDTYGHAVGDVVLSTVGRIIEKTVADAKRGGTRIAARLGGEEFAALVEGIGPKDAVALAQAIVDQVRAQPVVAGEHIIPATVSVGVAMRRAEDNADALLRTADRACYQAKRLGRDRCCTAANSDDRPSDGAEKLEPLRHYAAAC